MNPGRIDCGRFVLGCLMSSLAAGCADDDAGPADAGPRTEVVIDFALTVNGAPFGCGTTYDGVGAPASEFTATDARFYVHEVELLHASGQWLPLELDAGPFQARGLALLDFEDGCGPDGTAETHTELTGRVASTDDDFAALRFTLGVPPQQNFLDLAKAAPPLDVTGMFWTWQVGYKFLKVDGSTPASDGGIHPFLFHVGASGCPGTNSQAPPTAACSAPNLASYELEFSPGDRVVADLGKVFAESDLSFNTEGTAPGCMSEDGDPECLTLFPRLGLDGADDQRLFASE
jgi:uncharacterized repeat protein (TIGR04052 family)